MKGMTMHLGSFSIWSFVAGLLFAYFLLPMLLGAVGGRGKKAAA